jgi:hypothetical protein
LPAGRPQLRAFWAVTLEALIFTGRAPHRETSGVLPFALRASLLLFNFVPDKLSMAGPLSHLTARDGGNVGLAGALTDPADRPDISAVSAAAPEAQKTITAIPLFQIKRILLSLMFQTRFPLICS